MTTNAKDENITEIYPTNPKGNENDLHLTPTEALAILVKRFNLLAEYVPEYDAHFVEGDGAHYYELIRRIEHTKQGLRPLLEIFLSADSGSLDFYRVSKVIKLSNKREE